MSLTFIDEIFGSVTAFNEKFDPLNDPAEVVISFKESRVVDHSAIEALHKITERYHRVGKKVQLQYLSTECQLLLDNAKNIIEVHVLPDSVLPIPSSSLS